MDEPVYQEAEARREGCINAILRSDSKKIVVVAGPGTGKTTLFAKLLHQRGGRALTLTFINALVDELSLNLCELSEVRTLHGFAANFLKTAVGAQVFPKLSQIIQEDAGILLDAPAVNFDRIFHQCADEPALLAFYKQRKDYYGKYYGFADCIYGLVRYFEAHRDKIPNYSQVVVDEFQDFNRAEVTLIDLLAERSPVLITGDDDQSLYLDLKDASPDYIRQRHADKGLGYTSFPLPFCSRSTRVIVDAVNDVVAGAVANGLLKEHVDKPYIYFPSKAKDKESDANPRLIYTQYFEAEMPGLIQKELAKTAAKERNPFSVLVVVPPQLGTRVIPKFAKTLASKGFKNLHCPALGPEKKLTAIDGLKLLFKDDEDNLGWRIIIKNSLSAEEFRAILEKTKGEGAPAIVKLIPKELRKDTKRSIAALRKVRDDGKLSDEELDGFVKAIGFDSKLSATALLKDELLDDETFACPRSVRNIHITLTTVPRSKGLAADFVFITHFDDAYYTEGGKGVASDKNVFSFLVALTRARKRTFLVSSKEKRPAILGWIEKGHIQEQFDAPHAKNRKAAMAK